MTQTTESIREMFLASRDANFFKKDNERKRRARLPFTPLSERDQALCEIETNNRIALRAVTPDEWAARIATIPAGEIQNRVACIVWWDFFGSRPCDDAWTHLNEFINRPVARMELPSDFNDWPLNKQKAWEKEKQKFDKSQEQEIIAALHSIGYTAYSATMRVAGDEE